MRRTVRAAGVGAVALALAGCWYAPGQGPDRAGHNPFETQITAATVDDLTEQWTATTDEGAVQDPVVSKAGVHVVAGVSYYGFDTGDGGRMWKDEVPPDQAPFLSASPPITDGDRVLLGRGFGNLGGSWTSEWLDAATGSSLAGPSYYGLADSLRGSKVALRSYSFGSLTPVASYLHVADLDDPAAGWSGLVQISDGSGTSAVTLGTTSVFQADYGVVSVADPALPPYGNGVRAFPTTPPRRCGPNDVIVCPDWATPLPGGSSTVPVLGAGESVLYTGTDAGTLYAVNAATGAILWSAPVGAAVTATPALADGVLHVPTADGRVVALDADGCGSATCNALWTASTGTGSAVREQPAVAGGVVYTGSVDGGVHAFPAAGCGAVTCSPVWSASTGSNITGAPAVTNGLLYVGTADGRLIAYGLDD